MKLNSFGSKRSMSRREFLRGIRSTGEVTPIIPKEKCTGCGLCMKDCPTGALTISRGEKEDTYQLLFQQDLCNACGLCEASCPENCLRLEPGIKLNKTEKATKVIFEDEISRCTRCGILLSPQAMANNLKSKIFSNGEPSWSIHLCPLCGIKTQFEKGKIE